MFPLLFDLITSTKRNKFLIKTLVLASYKTRKFFQGTGVGELIISPTTGSIQNCCLCRIVEKNAAQMSDC
jgi:hypothetical protein